MKSPFRSNKTRPLQKPAPPSPAELLRGKPEDSDAQRAGRDVLAALGDQRTAELEQFAAAREKQRKAEAAADDVLYRQIRERASVAARAEARRR